MQQPASTKPHLGGGGNGGGGGEGEGGGGGGGKGLGGGGESGLGLGLGETGAGAGGTGMPALQFWLPEQGEQLPWPLQTCGVGWGGVGCVSV